jgi:hypothetical protein
VLPHGVRATYPVDGLIKMKASSHSVVEHFLDLSTTDNEKEAAFVLQDHVRRFATPELCVHGRRIHHADPKRVVGSWSRPDQFLLPVTSYVKFAVGFDALQRAFWLAHNHQPPSKAIMRDIALLMPGLSSLADVKFYSDDSAVAEELKERAFTERLENTTTSLLRDCGVMTALRWRLGRGPGPIWSSMTTMGLYVTVGREGPPCELVCQSCRTRFTRARRQRSGERAYCANPECEREPKRLNKRIERETQRRAGRE